ncbi:MAG TPA: hypothetical protein H9887_04130 [Candidatus Dorea intestinavium]|nr:hypothetical protein [Candidatus Dorea intestinavium]
MNNYTADELKQKSKKDLITISTELIQENERLRNNNRNLEEKNAESEREVNRLQAEVDHKNATWDEAGSLVEYCSKINELMETAQKTADSYLDNIKSVSDEKNAEAQKIVTTAEEKAKEIVDTAQEKAAKIKESSTSILEHLKVNVDKSLKDFEEKLHTNPEEE